MDKQKEFQQILICALSGLKDSFSGLPFLVRLCLLRKGSSGYVHSDGSTERLRHQTWKCARFVASLTAYLIVSNLIYDLFTSRLTVVWLLHLTLDGFFSTFGLAMFQLNTILYFRGIWRPHSWRDLGLSGPTTLVSTIYSSLLNMSVQQVFLVQWSVIGLAMPSVFGTHPIVGEVLVAMHHSLLYGMCSFEYQWGDMGLPAEARFAAAERIWPYLMGFGSSLVLVTRYLPYGHVLFALMTLLLITSANVVTMKRHYQGSGRNASTSTGRNIVSDQSLRAPRIAFFTPAKHITNVIFILATLLYRLREYYTGVKK